MTAELREQTPPPRRRGHAEEQDRAVQQPARRSQGGNAAMTPLTSSPLTRPKDTFDSSDAKPQGFLSPQSGVGKRDCLAPAKINGDLCFSSPNSKIGPPATPGSDLAESDPSPTPPSGSGGKENSKPAGALARENLRASTPMKTPSRLPTVQEHDGQSSMPTLDEQGFDEPVARETMPAWVVRSPEPAIGDFDSEELGNLLRQSSPAPPGLEDMVSELPKPTIKSTFIQFVSPLKTFSLMSPPKTEPVNFAPSTSAASALFGSFGSDHFDDGSLAMSHSPSPWFTHEQIPFFPASSVMPPVPSPDAMENVQAAANTGILRLSEFLPEAPSAPPCQSLPPVELDQGFCYNTANGFMPMAPMMPAPDAGSCPGADGPSCLPLHTLDVHGQWQQPPFGQSQSHLVQHCPPAMMGTEQGQPQLQEQPQQQQLQVDQAQQLQQMQAQMQQMQMQQLQMQPQMHMQPQMQQMQPQLQPQMPQMQQMQQMPQMQPQMATLPMQPPQMQPPQMQPPQMQPPQMQPPQMQPPQMQPPQVQPPQMQPENLFLQQLMQMQMQPQMQPPSWPPVQPPASIAGEQLPSPPLQTAMDAAAPSVLCPSTCHQAQLCRCGELRVGDLSASLARAATDDQPPSNGTAPNTCILLSAAMFPEMGTNM